MPLSFKENEGFKEIKRNDGKRKDFKTRKGVEEFCSKNKCAYVEQKFIFYK